MRRGCRSIRVPRGHGAFFTLVVNFVNLGLGVLTGVLTARALDPSDRGVYVGVVLWSTTIASYALVGLDHAVIFGGAGRWSTALRCTRALRSDLVIQAVIGFGFAACLNYVLFRDSIGYALTIALVGASVVPLNAVNQMTLAPLLGAQRLWAWNLLRLSPAVAYVVLALSLAAMGRFTVMSGLSVWIAANAVTAVLAFAVRRRLGAADNEVVDKAMLKRYGRRMVLVGLPGLVNQRLDQLMMVFLAPAAALGTYSVAVSVAAVAEILKLSVEQILFPRFVADRSLIAFARTAAILGIVASGILYLSVAPFLHSLISLVYGVNYVDAVDPLEWLLAAAALKVGVAVMAAAAKATNRLKLLAMSQLVTLVVTAAGVGVLLPARGLEGAAAAICLGQAINFAILWTTGGATRLSRTPVHHA